MAASSTRAKPFASVERKTIASAALRTSEIARSSARTHLGLDVVSFEEQEELMQTIAEAERAKVAKDVENITAMSHVDQLTARKAELKLDLRVALAAGEDDEAAEIEAELKSVVASLREAEDEALRSAAEKVEAEDISERTDALLAEANAANAIVLELAKVDQAILEAEQLVENAAMAKERATKVTEKVHAEAVQEIKAKETALKKITKVANTESKHLEREEKVLESLQAKASKKVSDKQREKTEMLATKAAKARAEAEQRKFEAEIEAVRLEQERLDAIAKAAAIERTLRGLRNSIDVHHDQQSSDALGLAALRREREDEHEKAIQKRRSSLAASKARALSGKGSARRGSFMERMRAIPSLSKDNKKKKKNVPSLTKDKAQARAKSLKKSRPASLKKARTKSLKRTDTQNDRDGKRMLAGIAAVDTGEPMDATSAFVSFVTGWAQSAAIGVEYLTGLRITGDDEETLRDDDGNTLLTYDDSDDEPEYNEDEFDEGKLDELLNNVGMEDRQKAAAAWVEFEINRLCDILRDIGLDDEEGHRVATFGELLLVYEDISDTLVGILVRAKRAGRVWYDGDQLFEVENEHTEVVLLDDNE